MAPLRRGLRSLIHTDLDTRNKYNNLKSELLGLVIERASGKRYATYLEEALWRPMGGTRAQVWLDSPNGAAHTPCCLATPAMD